MRHLTFIVILMLCIPLWYRADQQVQLNLKKEFVLGNGDLIFQRPRSLCEDSEKNLHVLDGRAFKVYKISKDGKLLSSFGRKGEGPGDFKWPYAVFVNEQDEIIVTEVSKHISIFTAKGACLTRKNIGDKMATTYGLWYAGGGLYYGTHYGQKGQASQVIFDINGNIINDQLFSYDKSLRFSTDRMTFTLRNIEYCPILFFSYNQGQAAAAFTETYNIFILNNKGKVIRTISRDIGKTPMTDKEHKFFAKEYATDKRMDNKLKNAVIKLIPRVKNPIGGIRIGKKYLFVRRIKADCTDEQSPTPIDIFTVDGKYLGGAEIKKWPILISDTHLYTIETDDEDDILVVKYSYKIN